VTGNLSKKHYTRKGVFNLTYKTKNVTLRGPGYASFVSYWMPFDGGIGLHDATWRDEFGGDIYKTNGSHGCVNLPYEVAKKIYENITKETPIVVW
jgi:lipoprotein-anchoring transpeptidase ErfK/SrfK